MKRRIIHNMKNKLNKLRNGFNAMSKVLEEEDEIDMHDFKKELLDDERVYKVLCHSKLCNKSNPGHKHFTEDCRTHPLCVADSMIEKRDHESECPQPAPERYCKSMFAQPAREIFLEDYD